MKYVSMNGRYTESKQEQSDADLYKSRINDVYHFANNQVLAIVYQLQFIILQHKGSLPLQHLFAGMASDRLHVYRVHNKLR